VSSIPLSFFANSTSKVHRAILTKFQVITKKISGPERKVTLEQGNELRLTRGIFIRLDRICCRLGTP
jgi:hypothetical protein